MTEPVVIEVALNGTRKRDEHPGVPFTPEEVAAEAARCRAAGATLAHIHARTAEGGWSVDPAWYGEAIRRIRGEASGMLVGITSIRPAGMSVWEVISALEVLAFDPATCPDLLSVNLGHLTAWEPVAGAGRRTRHYPNDYHDITALLRACARLGVAPELGVVDVGFVANAVALRADGALPEAPWFLVELDCPRFGDDAQAAVSSAERYDDVGGALAGAFRGATWAAHGNDRSTYAVVERALAGGAHVRVGFEDAVVGPDGKPSKDNAGQVAWAAEAAAAVGRRVAGCDETRRIVGVTNGQRRRP